MIKTSLHNIPEVKKPSYPYIGVCANHVILFIGNSTGITLRNDCPGNIGKCYDGWNEASFTVLQGEIVLSNV